jgi:hypothetical protein
MSETRKKSSKTHGGSERSRWSAKVTKHSDALDLERSVFKSEDPRKIALSLKRSADHSKRRKGTPYQSAMSIVEHRFIAYERLKVRHDAPESQSDMPGPPLRIALESFLIAGQ